MTGHLRICCVILFFSIVTLSGCSATKQQIHNSQSNGLGEANRPTNALVNAKHRTDNPQKSKLGVLIVSGEGFNTRFDDPRVAPLFLEVSKSFSNSLQFGIVGRGTPAQIYANTDQRIKPTQLLIQQMAVHKSDGVVQVSITQTKNGNENSIYLSATYYPLKWTVGTQESGFTLEGGPSAKLNLLGEDGKGKASYTDFADQFVEQLYREGYIGE
jgi:hypothetical protein